LGRTRVAAALPDLQEAQIELLRTLDDHGPLGTLETARRLRVAPSTVSNLVRTMSAKGLVERHTSATDLRATELTVSTEARTLLHRYDKVGGAVLREALDTLPTAERRKLDQAMPALTALLAALTTGDK
jgi:DNA-binding MarR family transcriptional regulator